MIVFIKNNGVNKYLYAKKIKKLLRGSKIAFRYKI